MPKISIITTTYKHSDFIAHTIESVLAQTYTDRELLIWDDSPDDATRDIIIWYTSRYPDKIKARHHTPNKWIVDNMNFLISQSSHDSEYLSLLEWDDMYTPDNLQEKIHIFERYPEVGLVYSDMSFIDKNNNTTLYSFYKKKDWLFMNNNIQDEYWFLRNPASIMSYSSSMIKKEIVFDGSIYIRSLRIWKEYSVSDREFYIKILTKYKSFFIDKPLVRYRTHASNISNTHWIIWYDMSIVLGTLFQEGFWDKKKALKIVCLNFFKDTNIHILIWRIKVLLYILFPSKYLNTIMKYIYWYKSHA